MTGERPLLRVLRGDPTAEELAALTVVVAALSERPGRRRERHRPAVGGWADAAARVRRPLPTGAGGWRAAGEAR